MTSVGFRIISGHGVEAEISCNGEHAGQGDYFATVSIRGQMQGQPVYGIDPVQALTLGLRLIEDLTQGQRAAAADVGEVWRLEAWQP